MKKQLVVVALGLLLLVPISASAESVFYEVVNPNSWVDLHQYSQARGKVTCRVPHREIIKVTDDRGRFKYAIWMRLVGDESAWIDPYQQRRWGQGHMIYCSRAERKGWIDTHDRGVTLKPRPDIRSWRYVDVNFDGH